jgi:hypothetical protein
VGSYPNGYGLHGCTGLPSEEHGQKYLLLVEEFCEYLYAFCGAELPFVISDVFFNNPKYIQ